MAVEVAIVGASGYAGIELAKLVAGHPELRLAVATADSSAGARLSELSPSAPDLLLEPTAALTFEGIELAFLCLPHGASARLAGRAVAAGARVVDLSSDLRLRDLVAAETLLGASHPAPELLPVPYGLPELGRPPLDSAAAVANPGCYATATLLAVAPLADHLEPDSTIVADAKSGASGAGRGAQVRMLFGEVAENLVPYKVGRVHHHVAEIEQELAAKGIAAGRLIFSPHLVPAVRGLLATVYLRVRDSAAAIRALRDAYASEPLVRVLPSGELPSFAHVARRPHAVLGAVAVDSRNLVVVSALDNLLKGAASQALQNANRMLGLPETVGLLERYAA